jgi:2-oxoglutarate dehydrogenase E1 component
VTRVILCSGKVYYELERHRHEQKRSDVAILRIEQLYPLEDAVVENALKIYRAGTPVFWVQEEPANMGAWPYIHSRFPFAVISRPPSASPATGSHASHKREQEQLIASAFGGSGLSYDSEYGDSSRT